MPVDTCKKATCTRDVDLIFAAKGTQYEVAVCAMHDMWAKEQILHDMPGHTVTREFARARATRTRDDEDVDLAGI